MVHENLSIIVAITSNFAIGKDGDLLFYLPKDLKHFKNTTTGHSIIMGRKTLETFPNGKPLPNRRNIVITNNKKFSCNGCEIVHSVEEAIQMVQHDEEAFVVGGATIYEQFLPIVNKLYLTVIEREVNDADVFFPKIDYNNWKEVSSEQHYDERNDFNYSFINLTRK